MDLPSILILAILIVLSSFFSASETALIALSPAKVHNLCNEKRRFSGFVKSLKDDPDMLLITILIGNNIVNILASVYATLVFTALFDSNAIGITTGIMTILILIFGEIVPKSFANKYAASLSLFVSPVLYMLSRVLYPAVWLLKMLVRGLEKLTGKSGSLQQASEDELLAMATIGAEEGSIEQEERELIENILEFNDIHVEDVMTPRVGIAALPASTTLKEAGEFVLDHTYTRIPVYQGKLNNVIGVVTVKDILFHLQKGEFNKPLKELQLQNVLQVTEIKKINDLFRQFQKSHIHMAIVFNEHGGVTGLVTLEDILEEIVGEIIDEHDDEEHEIKKIGNTEWEAEGSVEMHEINKALKTTFPTPEHKPLSFLIIQALGRFPKKGEKVEMSGFTFIVEDMDGKKITKVSIEKK